MSEEQIIPKTTLRNRAKRHRKGKKGSTLPWVVSETKVVSEVQWAMREFKKQTQAQRRMKRFRRLQKLMSPPTKEDLEVAKQLIQEPETAAAIRRLNSAEETCTSVVDASERCDVTRTESEPTSDSAISLPQIDTDAPIVE